jgi:hypothetical protein
MRYDIPNYLSFIPFIPAADVAADGNGSPFDLVNYVGDIAIRADIGTNTVGTNPVLALVIKESSDNSNWTNSNITLTGSVAGNALAQVVTVDTRAVKRYMRIDKDISGTNSPSFPVSVIGVATRQYDQG